MKIYICQAEYCYYGDNVECTVVAHNEEEALKLLDKNNIFDKRQGKIDIEEIDINKSQILTVDNY